MLRDQLVEGVKMAGLLVVHMLHEWPEMGLAVDERRRLGCVDEGGGELACLVDAQRGGEELALGLGKGLAFPTVYIR